MNRKIFIILCATLFSVVHSAFAQQMFVVDGNGQLKTVNTSEVDYATFTLEKDWFVIENKDIEDIGENLFSASCSVSLGEDIKSLCNKFEVGVCYSKETETPTINNQSMSIGTEMGDYTFTVSPVAPGTTYYYRVYVKLLNEVFYGDVVKVTTFGTAPVDNSKVINGHRFVDLGLPSGLLWAETNIGAETKADDGDYFAWGETTTKDNYDWDTYKYGSSWDDITKYNKSDGKTVLEPEDDAACVNWGNGCRMPTETELEELDNSDNCTWTWTSKTASDGNTINGYEVKSKKNGNSIFLPASGVRRPDDLYYHGSSGYYWSSTLGTDGVSHAYDLNFYSGYHNVDDYGYRYYGHSVRPVAEP